MHKKLCDSINLPSSQTDGPFAQPHEAPRISNSATNLRDGKRLAGTNRIAIRVIRPRRLLFYGVTVKAAVLNRPLAAAFSVAVLLTATG
jgi:hypothetical protein